MHADNQVLQVELEQLIKDCNAANFKSGYVALEAEFKTVQEKDQSLASFERIAQETKKEKIADLAKVLSRGTIQSYWPFAKLLIQGGCAGFFGGFLGAGFIVTYFWSVHDAGDKAYLMLAVPSIVIALPFAYCAKNNYKHAFHADAAIKEEIARLNEIMGFIEIVKTADA